MDDQTLEGGAGEEALELELEPETPGLGGDPLDEISDPVARAEAKKWRAIARRKDEKPEVKAEVPPPPSEFLTKADFFKSNERKAIREITADAEIKANWDAIIPFYTPRRGKETAEDIREDLQDAITLYRARNPITPEKDDSVNQLTTTTVVKTGGGPIDTKATKKAPELPNYNLPKQPSDWYAKKG